MRKVSPIDDDTFIRLWNALSSAEQVGSVLDCLVDTVRHRAVELRKQGHFLKMMRLDGLNAEELINTATMARGNLEGHELNVTPREFVLLWQLCNNLSHIVRVSGMTYDAVKSRGRVYRSLGVPLKKFKRGVRSEESESAWNYSEDPEDHETVDRE